MSGRVEAMHFGDGLLATVLTVLVSAGSGLVGGSQEWLRESLAGITQAQATLVVGLTIGLLTQVGVWLRWYLDARRKGKDDALPRG